MLTVAAPLDFNQNNLKYGLAYYAQKRQFGSVFYTDSNELAIREADESSSAIRYLLRPEFDATSLRSKPYYLWLYLRRTALALSYLGWEY